MFIIVRFLPPTPSGPTAYLSQEENLAPHLTVLKYNTLQNIDLLKFALFAKIP
jgi:hypothetical protein